MALSSGHKTKIKKAVGYFLKDIIALENAISGVPLEYNDLINKTMEVVTDNFEMLGNETELDAHIASVEAAMAIDDVLLTHTNSIIVSARNNIDLDNAILALNAAKT